MNKFIIAALITSLLAFGAIQESTSILINPSLNGDATFVFIVISITILLIVGAVFFWWKGLTK
jgi:hypothetical protein